MECKYIRSFALLLSMSLYTLVAQSEVKTDGTTGIKVNVASSSGEYSIHEDLGTKSGSNLFHSFSDFNIAANESAIFSTSSGVSDIISRVTGNNPTRILGEIGSTNKNVNFWMINPNGVVIGENASFNVLGSINLSTANSITFLDDKNYTTSSRTDNLSTSSPESYGFLQENTAATVVFDASIELNNQSLSLVSRSINIVDSTFSLNNSTLSITALGNLQNLPVNHATSIEFTEGDFNEISMTHSHIQANDTESQVNIFSATLSMANSSIATLKNDNLTTDNVVVSANKLGLIDSQLSSASQNTNGAAINETSSFGFLLDEFDANSASENITRGGESIDTSHNDYIQLDLVMKPNDKRDHHACNGPTGAVSHTITSEAYFVDPTSFNPGEEYRAFGPDYHYSRTPLNSSNRTCEI